MTKHKKNPNKFVLNEGDGEFFTKDGEVLDRKELARRREAHSKKKKSWELEMQLRRDEKKREEGTA